MVLGTDVSMPSMDITGFLSSTWIYVFFVAIIGFIIIAGIALLLFFLTYNRKIILFENVSGQGYQPVMRTRARIIKVGQSGVEVLKTLKGAEIISAYGRRMGKNSYWFGKGQDGYWYNITLGDLDEKLANMGVEPVNPNVRMFHAARNKLTDSQYGEQKNWVEKYAPSIILLFTVIVLMVGLYIVSGQINEGLQASNNPEVAETNKETAELLNQMASRLDRIQRGVDAGDDGSGLVPATDVNDGGG